LVRPRSFALPLLALALAMALRAFVIEPSHIAHACDPAPWSGWCAARTALVMSFRSQEIGWAALALGLSATLLRREWLGQVALALGLVGLVLYSYEPAVVGALLGMLVLFRPRRGSQASAARPAPGIASSESR
jgi:hypothetical protein